MKRGGPLKRNKRLNPISKRRRKRDANYEQARREAFDRAAGICEVRTSPDCTWRATDIHHIAGRGGPDPHRLSNLIAVCRADHSLIHDQPEWSYKWGWLAHRNGSDAA